MPAVSAFLIPFVVLGAFLFLFVIVAVLARFRGGRYLRPLVAWLAKVPLIGRGLKKASMAQLERENPELARVFKKMEAFGQPKTPEQAQRALARLSPAELRAYRDYLATAGDELPLPEATNRAGRRSRAQPGVMPTPRPTTRKKRR
jgi:hypothetical protein